MDNESRWLIYLDALHAFMAREGHARVPTTHIEAGTAGPVHLGAWVGYMRQRHRKGVLGPSRTEALAALPGWEWGPLRPGPPTNRARNDEIRAMRASGASLQRIADYYGLSRQRVHQITQNPEESA